MPQSSPAFDGDVLDLGTFSVRGGTSTAVIASVLRRLDEHTPVRLAFCNAHTLALAFKDQRYAEALSCFTLLNDGVGLDLAAVFFHGRRFPENLNGTDFIPNLLRCAPRSRLFLLGGRPEVVQEAARRMQDSFGHLEVVGFHHGYFDKSEVGSVIDAVRETDPDIVLVGMGNPAQELFTLEHGAALGARMVICCGALFDFTAGQVRRAPLWVRRLRLEWVYRVLQEPRRLLGRYTVEAAGLGLALVRLKLSRVPGPRAGDAEQPGPHYQGQGAGRPDRREQPAGAARLALRPFSSARPSLAQTTRDPVV